VCASVPLGDMYIVCARYRVLSIIMPQTLGLGSNKDLSMRGPQFLRRRLMPDGKWWPAGIESGCKHTHYPSLTRCKMPAAKTGASR
jgi:hypothetical protein